MLGYLNLTLAFADAVLSFADDRRLAQNFGLAGRHRILRLCDPEARSADLLDRWLQASHLVRPTCR